MPRSSLKVLSPSNTIGVYHWVSSWHINAVFKERCHRSMMPLDFGWYTVVWQCLESTSLISCFELRADQLWSDMDLQIWLFSEWKTFSLPYLQYNSVMEWLPANELIIVNKYLKSLDGGRGLTISIRARNLVLVLVFSRWNTVIPMNFRLLV